MWEHLQNTVVVVLMVPIIVGCLALTIQFINNASRNMSSTNVGTSMGILDTLKGKKSQ